ncbi:MAG: DNA methyltransferase [Chloroflexales bacterium]|jgi:hypothetical protein
MTDIASRAAAFIQKWAAVTINERAVAQTHFNELCALIGAPAPLDKGQQSSVYRFEQPLTKSGGGAGFADVWKKDHFAWEYKTKGKYPDLRAAYTQLVLYKGDLGNPPVLVACDIENYYVSIEFTGYRTQVEQFTNADLHNASTRELLRQIFTLPEQLRPVERAETITEKAARQLADIARLLEGRGFAPADIAPFLMKVLFALFAEDIRLLPAELMSRSIRDAIFDPGEFVAMTRSLFQTMNTGGYFGPGTKVPRFNGWLFADVHILPLDATELQYMSEVAKLDWSSVEPAIFGTLFERSLDPTKRAQLGAHYTSRDDILLIVEPVLMQPYRRAWAQVQAGVDALHTQWQTTSGAARQRLRSVAETMIFDFMDSLSEVRVLDPACGSGNFLYVALHQLKDLEHEVWRYAGGFELTQPELGVTPAQFYGIEKNPFAAELAQVVIWIGYLQWMKQNGWLEGPTAEPVLHMLHTIECKDAILSIGLDGQSVEPEWPEADVIMGNPPFLGAKDMRDELGDIYTTTLRTHYSGRVPGGADLVTYWFERARAFIEQKKVRRAGLLATKVIRQKNSRPVLDRIKATGNIFMALSDRPWVLNGASLHIVVICFDDGSENEYYLDEEKVTTIHSDLTAVHSISQIKQLQENAEIVFMGVTKAGASDINQEIAEHLLAAPANASGRPNSDVVRPWLIGEDITDRPRHKWIIDFGVDASEEDAAQYEAPYAYLREHVMPARIKNDRASHQAKWWIHERPRPVMRKALRGLSRYIATVLVAKHRLFVWVPSHVLPAARLYVFARTDDYFFGILHSKAHELWSLRMAGQHGGERPTYNAPTCFETYPFPWPPGCEPMEDADPRVRAIADAARELVRLRDKWLNPPDMSEVELKKRTLTSLYNKHPDWLSAAHRTLDTAVYDAYAWPHDLSDDDILSRLLALNLERA